MRILYSAIDQSVPGSHGGAVHVTSVAEGLAARGHEVHALVARPSGSIDPDGPVHWHAMTPPFGLRQLRAFRAGSVTRLAKGLRPDVIMERYYNFGGEAILAARRLGIFSVLEVNAPVIDYAGSPKTLLDRALLIQPMRRWRDWQCASADLIVTPSPKILPPGVPASKVLQAEWGADTLLFHPGAGVRGSAAGTDTVAVFVGAFRKWHGAIHLVNAIRQLRERGRRDITALFVGDGPQLPAARQAAEGLDGVQFIGALPHGSVPRVLAESHIGVAPFDVDEHPPLATDFYWSPLKVFEYMASGLPVVAPKIPRLASIVRDGREGLLYDASNPSGLAAAIERLAEPALRNQLGLAARQRVVEHFSWRRHCEHLDLAIQSARERRAS